MAIHLRQSTASQEILLGTFLDETDGATPMTGLTIANTDIKIWKAGATSEANKNSGGGTHIAAGRYYAVLDATDTNTLGSGEINVHMSGALPVRREILVLPANVFDSLILGTDLLDANASQVGGQTASAAGTVTFPGTIASTTNITAGTITTVNSLANNAITAAATATDFGTEVAAAVLSAATASPIAANAVQISGDSGAADNLETAFDNTAGPVEWTQITDQGTAQSATDTTLVIRSGASFADHQLRGQTVWIVAGSTGVGESRLIEDNVGSTDTLTVKAWDVTPTGTIRYKIYPTPPASTDSPLPVNVTSVEGVPLNGKVGDNFNSFFHNGGNDTTQTVDDVGSGGGGSDSLILQETTIATLSSQTSFTLTAGSADDDAYNGCMLICTDQSTAVQKCVGEILDYTGSTRTVTLAASPGIFTMATGDNIKIFPTPKQLPNALPGTAGGLITSGTGTAQLSTSSGQVLVQSGTGTGQLSVTSGVVASSVSSMGAGVITATAIASNAITDTKINSGAITAAKFASGAIDATAIASNAITAAKIASDAITAAKIASDAITSAKVADGFITAAKIANDAITDAKVASDVTIASVTGAVGSVTGAVGSVIGNVGGNVTGSVGSVVGNVGGNVTGTVGSVVTKTGYELADGAITAAKIAADAITAAKVASDVGAEIAAAVLSAASSTPIEANVKEINDVALVGDGDSTPWGPA